MQDVKIGRLRMVQYQSSTHMMTTLKLLLLDFYGYLLFGTEAHSSKLLLGFPPLSLN
jgi:hypothetical protein